MGRFSQALTEGFFMTTDEAYTLFMEDRQVSGVSHQTLLFYGNTVKKFVEFAGPNKTLEKASKRINRYFIGLQDRGLAQASIHSHWRAIKAFWHFVVAEEYIDQVPKLPRIKPSAKQVRPLSVKQVRQILNHFGQRKFTDFRNGTIFRLMYDTGLRLSEVAGLDAGKIDLGQRLMYVLGKGQKERWVPFSDSTKQCLWEYMKKRASRVSENESALFITRSGKRMTPRGIQVMFRRLADEVGLDDVRLSAHTLRHPFALSWIETGGDPFSLQRILGHSSQQTTARYVNMGRTNIQIQHDRHSPGDRI